MNVSRRSFLLAFPALTVSATDFSRRAVILRDDGVSSLQGALLDSYAFDMDLQGQRYAAHGFDVETTETGFVRRFALGSSESTSFISVDKGLAFGVLHTPEGDAFAVESWRGGRTVRKLDLLAGLSCDGALRMDAPQHHGPAQKLRPASMPGSRRRAVGASSAVVNVFFVYTADALAAAGGEEPLIAWLKSALAFFSVIAKDSGVHGLKVQFAGALLAPFAARNNGHSDIAQARDNPEVARWRAAARGDLVGVITEDGGSSGMCPVEDGEFQPAYGFFTVPRRRPLLGYGFVHELGHTFGLNHDSRNAAVADKDPRPYRRAFPNPNVPFQTVMGGYYDSTGLFYPIIPRFSNPGLPYKGFATGAPAADNARGLREGMEFVGRYKLRLEP